MSTKLVYLHQSQNGFETDSRNLVEVIDKLQRLLESVPEEYRNSVKIDIHIEPQSGWDNDYNAHVEIYYVRPYTKQELHEIAEHERLGKQREEERQRQEYLKLKQKFEGENSKI